MLDPSDQQTQAQLDQMYDDFEKYTTMMYRPPEMIDKYKRWDVNARADIWMIGCVAFTIVFAEHPFKDA